MSPKHVSSPDEAMKRKPSHPLYQAPSTSIIGGRRLTNAQALGLSHSLGRRTLQFYRLMSTTAPPAVVSK